MNKIKIGIADDHALFRKGMMAMLSHDEQLEFIIEAENGQDLINLLKSSEEPDILLLDLRMPKLNGVETMDLLRQFHPKVKTIIISVHDDQDIIEHLFEKGANGYLNKNSDPEEVLLAIKNVCQFDFHFNLAATRALKEIEKKQIRISNKLLNKNELTERESDILTLICKEHTNIEIAKKLNISQRTVESYRVNLLNKSSSRNTAGLVLFAIKNNLISTADLKIRYN